MRIAASCSILPQPPPTPELSRAAKASAWRIVGRLSNVKVERLPNGRFYRDSVLQCGLINPLLHRDDRVVGIALVRSAVNAEVSRASIGTDGVDNDRSPCFSREKLGDRIDRRLAVQKLGRRVPFGAFRTHDAARVHARIGPGIRRAIAGRACRYRSGAEQYK